VVDDVVAQWWTEQLLHLGVFLAGIAASAACLATEHFPGAWPIAAGLIIVYLALFLTDMAVAINNICELIDDAFSRFWMIIFLGLALLLTIAGLDFIKPGVALWITEKATEETSGLFAL